MPTKFVGLEPQARTVKELGLAGVAVVEISRAGIGGGVVGDDPLALGVVAAAKEHVAIMDFFQCGEVFLELRIERPINQPILIERDRDEFVRLLADQDPADVVIGILRAECFLGRSEVSFTSRVVFESRASVKKGMSRRRRILDGSAFLIRVSAERGTVRRSDRAHADFRCATGDARRTLTRHDAVRISIP